MTWTWILIAAVVLPSVVWSVALVRTLLTLRRIRILDGVPPELPEWPTLSVVSPARDEVGVIESALRSVLASEYPSLEVVAVDDRSTDGTGAAIDSLAATDARLLAVHVEALPAGWLGKLNALEQGVRRSTGDWLLFADADTHYSNDALRRAVAYAESRSLDLLTVYPEVTSRAFLSDTVFAVAPLLAAASMPMYAAADPKSKTSVGFGAFILVRRSFYDRTPGLEWLRLEVADDLGLGLLIKSHGGKIEAVNGRGCVFIEFYTGYGEMIRKMQKNGWANFARFSVARGSVVCATFVWFALAPLAVFASGLPAEVRAAAGVGQVAIVVASLAFNRWVRRPLLPALFAQVGLLLCALMLVRAMWVGKRIGGIEWRGVRYRTEELAAHQRVKV